MKKFISIFLSICLLAAAAGCAEGGNITETEGGKEASVVLDRQDQSSVYGVEAPESNAEIAFTNGQASFANTQVLAAHEEEEMRGIWLAYVNYESIIKGNTQAQFTANMNGIFKNIKESGFNTVFAQVRPFGDALYDSKYFPWSRYLTGTEGKNPGYDPLAVMCKLANDHGLRIEAWINPYRVRTDNRALSMDNQAQKWMDAGNSAALTWNGGIYYNPGNAEARKLIVNGVREIVEKYDVDGIHFDDYFYPTTDMRFDAQTYASSGSKLSQADWRRENVNLLVAEVYKTIKAINPDCVFGISPQGNMSNNYDGQFIDCAKWLSQEGYVDYICPQIYYGFKNGTNPYAATVKKWDDLIKTDNIKLYVGVAAYKLGAADQWAGTGQNEWIGTTGLLSDMVKTARDSQNYGGVALYNYDSLFSSGSNQVKKELSNLTALFS